MNWSRSLRNILKLLSGDRHTLTVLGLRDAPRQETAASRPVAHCQGVRRAYKPHRLNAAGPFYSVRDGCIVCLAPQAAAPHVMGFYRDPSGTHARSHCFFKKQPQTPEEVDEAIAAMSVSCVENLRYGGRDPEILRRLCEMGYRHLCDTLSTNQADKETRNETRMKRI